MTVSGGWGGDDMSTNRASCTAGTIQWIHSTSEGGRGRGLRVEYIPQNEKKENDNNKNDEARKRRSAQYCRLH